MADGDTWQKEFAWRLGLSNCQTPLAVSKSIIFNNLCDLLEFLSMFDNWSGVFRSARRRREAAGKVR
jgi:hypothetical protein